MALNSKPSNEVEHSKNAPQEVESWKMTSRDLQNNFHNRTRIKLAELTVGTPTLALVQVKLESSTCLTF